VPVNPVTLAKVLVPEKFNVPLTVTVPTVLRVIVKPLAMVSVAPLAMERSRTVGLVSRVGWLAAGAMTAATVDEGRPLDQFVPVFQSVFVAPVQVVNEGTDHPELPMTRVELVAVAVPGVSVE
jgi:hypothetical protein